MLQARRAGPLGGRAPLAALLTLLLALAPSSVDGDWRATAEADKAAAAVVTSRAWGAMQHRVGSLVLEGRRVSDVLGPVLKHNFTLPPAQLAKALVYTGANFRLRRTVHDLVTARRPVRVGAVGGSITHGAKSSQPGKTDWFSLVGAYLRTAFPHAEISMRNGALPATPSALMNMCLEQYVDADVDLIFVEYVANDGSNRFDEVKAKVYERLLRKLLNRPSRPAVVLLQLMPKGMAYAAGSSGKASFHATLEDIYGAQAQYYDLPWLSWRNAMWRLADQHKYGYNWTDFMWDADFMHPIDPGMAAIADMAVHLVQQTALGLLLHPLSRADRELLHEQLPPPMHPGNWEARNLMCTYGEAFRPLVDAAASSGWSFINEGRPGAPKWGYIARKPGAALRIVVDSRAGAPPAGQGGAGAPSGGSRQQHDAAASRPQQHAQQRMSVMIAYLKSYEGMGMASFECTRGCDCEGRPVVDGLHALRQSTIYLVRLLVSQAARCEVSITLLNQTRDDGGGHKFKVSGIMMNEYTGDDVTEKLHEEQWLTQLQATAHGGTERAAGVKSKSKTPSTKAEIKAALQGASAVAVADGAKGESPSDRRRQRRRRRTLLGSAVVSRALRRLAAALDGESD